MASTGSTPHPCFGTTCLGSPTSSPTVTRFDPTPLSVAPVLGTWIQVIHCYLRGGCYAEVQPGATTTLTTTTEVSIAPRFFSEFIRVHSNGNASLELHHPASY